MIASSRSAMLAGVAETEPDRIWFGRGGRVERHDDGRCAVFLAPPRQWRGSQV